MNKETRYWKDENGIEHYVIDCYSNAKERWQAAKRVIGQNASKEEVEEWLDTKYLEVIDGGTNGRWYVCWHD